MLKQYALEAAFWIAATVGPIVLIWIGRYAASALARLAPKVTEAISVGIDHLIAWSKSALVDRMLTEARALIGPIVEQAFSTASKEILKSLADGKINSAEAQLALRVIGQQVKADVKAATAVWKERMAPYLGDTDKLIEAVTEEIYEVVKRNFLERNSEPAQSSGVPQPKSN